MGTNWNCRWPLIGNEGGHRLEMWVELIGNERPIRIVGGHLLQMKVGTNWNWGWALIGNKGGNQLKFWWALIGNVPRNYCKPSNVATQNNEHILAA